MNALKKITLMIMTCILMIGIKSSIVYASSGTISLSDPTAEAGDSVSVTVKVTATGSTTIKSVDMELTYDKSVLEFVSGTQATGESGTIQLSGTADSSIKTYSLEFKALKAGTSNIKISTYDIKDSNDTAIEMSKVGSSTVTISGDLVVSDTQAEVTTNESTDEDQQQETETEETQDSKIVTPPKKDVEVEIAGTPFYVCKIPESVIPEGFEYIGYLYDGVAVDALKKDDMILFYLNQIGEEPYCFYVYDEENNGFSIYAPIYPNLEYSVVNLDEGVEIPSGFTSTAISVGGVAVSGWQSDSNSEYYLLYLMTSEGNKNLYLYDVVEKTVQRYYYETDTTETSGDSYQVMYAELNDKYNSTIQSKMRIIYALIVLAVILIFAIIHLAFKLSDKRHPIIEEDEEDETEEIWAQEIQNEDLPQDDINKDLTEKNQFDDNYEDDYDEEFEDDMPTKKEMRKAAKLEKKEKAKSEKANKAFGKKKTKEDELENSEDDFDDSDDFELQIFDLDDDNDKK
ncbi:cohesin domain-containing protein [Lachnotalea glycerini]|uniref:Cohesin domain-containing protein n=1 Tax=Lachnotalea glycerini TaxID=1763509 RepID=A0A318ELN5_9FIRM|nr:cohesin domain-containing protein [Lachnotalea glycerini]PXV84605.1 cohesin domain-containing protein [Lachnotalea glycerini]